jgi:putative membrane protein
MKNIARLCAFGALVCSGVATAQQAKPADPPSAAKPVIKDVDDKQFVLEAASVGMAETELGRLAQKRGSSPEVKQFGAMMVKDHTAANKELKKIAAKKKFPLPTALSTEDKEHYEELAKLKGKDFDEKFMETMVKGHDKAIASFENVVEKGQDPDIKAWAEKTLPTLKAHKDHAKTTEKKVD